MMSVNEIEPRTNRTPVFIAASAAVHSVSGELYSQTSDFTWVSAILQPLSTCRGSATGRIPCLEKQETVTGNVRKPLDAFQFSCLSLAILRSAKV
jgi:hypothetical protein